MKNINLECVSAESVDDLCSEIFEQHKLMAVQSSGNKQHGTILVSDEPEVKTEKYYYEVNRVDEYVLSLIR